MFVILYDQLQIQTLALRTFIGTVRQRQITNEVNGHVFVSATVLSKQAWLVGWLA